MRAGGGFRVILHGERRDIDALQAFDHVIVQIDMADEHLAVFAVLEWRVDGFADWRIHGEAMVVRGDFDFAGGHILDRLVDAAVAEFELVRAEAERAAQQLVAEARSLDQASDIANAFEAKSLTSQLINEAQNELELSAGSEDNEGIKERTGFRLERRVAAVGRYMGRGNGYLATIGAISPFVGLFGTVWGIMNSFIGIAQTQTTNLAVVAPGIAEALLATAIGLFAAIPAVVIYNIFARMIASYKASLGDVAAQVLLLQSRDLDLSASGVKPVRTAQKLRVG